MAELTPMMKQYQEIKSRHRDDILFFRMGDFYEMFGPDAEEAARLLNITLTARNKGKPTETPMCGVPYHAAEGYIAKLTKEGKRVAICEQVSDPSDSGLVERDVVRVVTPGTTLDENLLNNKHNNFIVSLAVSKGAWGLAVCDVTTGEFQATEVGDLDLAANEIKRLAPSEVIVTAKLFNDTHYEAFIKDLPNVSVFQMPPYESAKSVLAEHFEVPNMSSYGLEELPQAIEAAGVLLGYLKETQKTSLDHVSRIKRYALEDFMVLDHATIRNLELLCNSWTFDIEGSLIGVIDQTMTSMGGRLLRKWLLAPLIDVDQIRQRLEAVAELKDTPSLSAELVKNLKEMSDLERLLGRIGCNRASARDLVSLKNGLTIIPDLKDQLHTCSSALVKDVRARLGTHHELVALIDEALVEDPPIALNEGGMIKDGFNQELDDLRKISTGGKQWLADFQAREIDRTGINSLKVKYNKVFGYYIEISKSNLDAVPLEYVRKQTLVNAERFIVPELKEYEEKILGAEDKIKALEYRLFGELRSQVVQYFDRVQGAAAAVAELDVILGFAVLAKKNKYVRPVMIDDGSMRVKKGRHPVIERYQDRYVPNDIELDHQANECILLTGPNMSGKSSYLRQVAIISLMAQIGSFVPADEAHLSVVDRIFTRVGASDNLSQGVSTFMNEMQEAANILHNATSQSLIILDEIGRGTSTYDGLSIAWAIVEHIHEKLKAKTLFATHYHELVQRVEQLARGQNYCVAVSEDKGNVVFLHQIIKGASSRSYGIEVAKLAGLPGDLIARSREILEGLEKDKAIQINQAPRQQSLLEKAPEPTPSGEVEAALRQIDVDRMTPLEALQKLAELRQELDS